MSDDGLPTDYEIAQSVELQPIDNVAEPYGIRSSDLEFYGETKAKLSLDAIERLRQEQTTGDERLVLVTGMTPTPLGEGKTVTTIGLGQAFNTLGHKAVSTIREPSLGPVFGIKGGAAGGGYAQALPMEDINLHFTGDIHALTAAHNLIAAMLDAHLSKGNELNIDPTTIEWQRAVDMNDRALRQTIIGVGGARNGVTREDGFILTAASELMAILALAENLADLKARIGQIILAYNEAGDPVTVDDLEATGAATMLLRDAIKPNLVQTVEHTPVLIHAGPFANIAHGTNSLIANRAAFGMGDWVVTEAGFGSDLGAEKFMNVVSRAGGVHPDVTVLVVSARALKYHGKDMWPPETDALETEDLQAIRDGFDNLDRHVRNLQQFGIPVVVAINRFPFDTQTELDAIKAHCREDLQVPVAVSEVFTDGGAGGTDLARTVVDTVTSQQSEFRYLYDVEASVKSKIETIATDIYGASKISYDADAESDIERLTELGLDELPIVLSKTFHSLSDDPAKKGAPEDWTLDVREVYPSAGAGFLVVLTGDVMDMPGLPARPAAAEMDIDPDGTITGLF